ncbi:hypothetical protein CLD22_25260, partial [Rubrivivax gelatinosus]|nr:hypothetical protein [Rubrivivax gelatinosus]
MNPNFFIRCVSLLAVSGAASLAQAEIELSTTESRQGDVGAETARQSTALDLYTTSGGVKVGPSATTTVTGGVSQDGSGNFIPDGTRGSQSDTSYGVTVTIPLPE